MFIKCTTAINSLFQIMRCLSNLGGKLENKLSYSVEVFFKKLILNFQKTTLIEKIIIFMFLIKINVN